MSLVSMLIAFCSRRDELMNFFSRNREQVFTCAMFLEKKFISSSLPDTLSSLCDNHMPEKESEKPAHKRHKAFLVTLEPKHRISDAGFKQIAAVYNSMVGHWGLQKCREFLKDPTITDRTITQFIRQCPCCQVMSRLNILIKTHPTIHSRVYT